MRVLIVDGDVLLGMQYAEKLPMLGFDVMTAETLARGVEVMDEWTPDAIVLDPNVLCGIDTGLAFWSMLLKTPIPVILLTALGDEVDARGVPFRVEGCCGKPLAPTLLAKRLRAIPVT